MRKLTFAKGCDIVLQQYGDETIEIPAIFFKEDDKFIYIETSTVEELERGYVADLHVTGITLNTDGEVEQTDYTLSYRKVVYLKQMLNIDEKIHTYTLIFVKDF